MVALTPAVKEVEKETSESMWMHTIDGGPSRLVELTSQLATQWGTLNAAYTDRQQSVEQNAFCVFFFFFLERREGVVVCVCLCVCVCARARTCV